MRTSYTDVNCMVSNINRPHPDADSKSAKVWSLSFKPDQETAFLFPYINGVLDDALWYEHPEHVTFLFEGYRCVLYPDLAAVHFFETRQGALAFIPRFMNYLETLDRDKERILPNLNQIRHISVLDIFRLLPRSNCRDCGFTTCMAFSAAVAKGKAVADQCPGLAQPMSESAVYPVFDSQGRLVDSVSLKIDTAGLKQRILDQEKQIRMLEAQFIPFGGSHGHMPCSQESPGNLDPALTHREIQVLELIAQGYTNNEIGQHLFISPHTVKSHMIHIFNKLNVSDRTQAAVTGVRMGMI
jgi:DNA-binding CsgD family transcriptional regulator